MNVSATNEQSSPKLQSSVMVKITVIENKNYAPAFKRSEYNFNVSEGADIGFTLGSVSAADVNQVHMQLNIAAPVVATLLAAEQCCNNAAIVAEQ